MPRGKRLYYQSFAVSSDTAAPEVLLNLHTDCMDDTSVTLSFTKLSGDVAATFKAGLQETLHDVLRKLQDVVPGVRIGLIFSDGTFIDYRSEQLTMDLASVLSV